MSEPAAAASPEKKDENVVQKAGHAVHGAAMAVGQGVVDTVSAGAGVNSHGTNVDHQVKATKVNDVVAAGAGANAHGTNVDHQM
mmetsp:Transcript_9106/g.25204  ORF Transcript_9106/g.25204 Transcript_9106/m.25204 type:complete len:84 (-) Transcript_9106:63-314(-)